MKRKRGAPSPSKGGEQPARDSRVGVANHPSQGQSIRPALPAFCPGGDLAAPTCLRKLNPSATLRLPNSPPTARPPLFRSRHPCCQPPQKRAGGVRPRPPALRRVFLPKGAVARHRRPCGGGGGRGCTAPPFRGFGGPASGPPIANQHPDGANGRKTSDTTLFMRGRGGAAPAPTRPRGDSSLRSTFQPKSTSHNATLNQPLPGVFLPKQHSRTTTTPLAPLPLVHLWGLRPQTPQISLTAWGPRKSHLSVQPPIQTRKTLSPFASPPGAPSRLPAPLGPVVRGR